jgi:hypothetical protein
LAAHLVLVVGPGARSLVKDFLRVLDTKQVSYASAVRGQPAPQQGLDAK